jgi:lysophospholipase L1-like esterase
VQTPFTGWASKLVMSSCPSFSLSKLLGVSSGLILCFILTGCGGGTTGNNPTAPTWQYTALGDSLADGVLAQQGYVQRYATYVNLDTGANVTTTNLGVPGWHSGDLLNAIQTDQHFKDEITAAQVLTWDIGGDDLANAHDNFTGGTCGGTDNQDCLRDAVATFKTNWDAIISNILQLRTTSNTIIRTMDIYNPYVASDMQKGIFDTVEPYLDEVNNYIHSTAAANSIPVADVHQAFNGADGTTDPGTLGLIAVDGFHPNDAGHKLIADQLRLLQYAPLH